MRIDRYLTLCDMGSRKDARALVMAGRVAVDGKTIRDPGLAVKGEVTVDGAIAPYRPLVAVMMNKPKGCVCAVRDGGMTVLDYLPPEDQRREPAPVGRLDKDTTGLIFITDDGTAAHALIAPKSHVEKCYIAVLDGPVGEKEKEIFAGGIAFRDFTALPARLEPMEGNMAACTVTEGKFHQVKRMFAAVGREVLELKRVRIGTFTLPDDLAEGEIRHLDMETWNKVRVMAGLGPWEDEK